MRVTEMKHIIRIIISYVLCAGIVSILLFRTSIYARGFTPFARMSTAWVLCGLVLMVLLTISVMDSLRPQVVAIVNIPVAGIYLIFVALALIASCLHRITAGMRPSLLVSVLMLGLYYVWIRWDVYQLIITRLSRTLLVLYSCFAAVSLAKIHPDSLHLTEGFRYVGITSNPNGLGALMAGAVVCGVFIMVADSRRWRIAALCLSLFSGFVLLLTQSRTALLAVVVAIMLGVAVSIKRAEFKNPAAKRIVIGIILLVFAGLVAAIIIMLAAMRSSSFEGNEQSGLVVALDIISSGRTGIWRDVIGNLTLWGVDPITHPIATNGVWMPDAHNIPLSYAYTCGVGAGLAYLLFEIGVMVTTAARAFSRKAISADYTFTLVSVFSFFVYSMIEYNADMVRFPYALLFSVALAPIVFQSKPKCI